jgi:hypothetical protein
MNREDFGNWFSYSPSGWKLFRGCQRAWYYRKVAFWLGWLRNAPYERRLPYVLSKLNSIPEASGQVLHELAAQVLRGQAWIPGGLASAYTLAMNEKFRQSTTEGHWSDPKHCAKFFEHYYSHPDPAGLFRETVAAGQVAAENIRRMTCVAKARACRIIGIESPVHFLVDGIPLDLKIDLMFEDQRGVLHIVDFKSGTRYRLPERIDRGPDHADQLMTYALGAHLDGGREPSRIRCTVAFLGDRSEYTFVPLATDLAKIRERIRRQADQIKIRLFDPAVNSGPKARFEPTTNAKTCARCQMYHACKGSRNIPRDAP